MIVVTKESLIRGIFPCLPLFKYGFGCISYEEQLEFKWLAQRGKCPEVPGSMPGGAQQFA
jgi:hypothetical protein